MKVLPPCDFALIPSLISGLHSIFSQGPCLLQCTGWASSLDQSEPQDPASPVPGSCRRGESLLTGGLLPGVDPALATGSQSDAGQTELVGSDHQPHTVPLLEAQPATLNSAEEPNCSQPWLEATDSCFEHLMHCVLLTNLRDLVSMSEIGQPQWVALFAFPFLWFTFLCKISPSPSPQREAQKALLFCEALSLYSDEHRREAQEGISNYVLTDGLNTMEGRPMGSTLGKEKKNTKRVSHWRLLCILCTEPVTNPAGGKRGAWSHN